MANQHQEQENEMSEREAELRNVITALETQMASLVIEETKLEAELVKHVASFRQWKRDQRLI